MSALWIRYPSGSFAGGTMSFMSAYSMGREQCKASYWNVMKKLLEVMLDGEYEEFHMDAFEDEVSKVILFKSSKFIYEEFNELLDGFLEQTVTDISEPVSREILKKLINVWLEFKTRLIRIRILFKILDRIVFYENEKYNIVSLGAYKFCEAVILSDTMRPRIQKVMLEMLKSEREAQLVDRMIFKKFCIMLKCFGQLTYKQVFEEQFLQNSREFYGKEAQRLLLFNDSALYVQGVHYILKREEARVNYCLLEETQKRNIELAEEELISKTLNTVINMDSSGLAYMLKKEMHDDITLMYTLVKRVKGGLQTFADSFCLHLENYWETLLKKECFCVSNYEEYVTCVFSLKDELNLYITQCFNNDIFLKKRTVAVFTKVINRNRELPESLAMYLHSKLCANTKGVLSYEKDKLLDSAIEIFRMLHDKDVFKYFYVIKLSERIRHNQCYDDGSEEYIISNLKRECHTFTSAMQGMMKDMSLSSRLNQSFIEYVWHQKKKTKCPEIYVRVLTPAYWPFRPEGTSCIIPCREYSAYMTFKKFYETVMKDRRLVLLPQFGTSQIIFHFTKNIHSMSHASVCSHPEVRNPSKKSCGSLLPSQSEKHTPSGVSTIIPASFAGRSCIIHATTYQMCILVLFNKYRQLTFEEIQNKTGIPHDNLKFALESLSEEKTNNLLKKKTTTTAELYKVNKLFCPLPGSVNIMRALETRDTEAEGRHLSINRVIRLDTVIAQIMSVRKTLPFHLIVSEVRAILRTEFQPSSIFILKRIETLIERKILKRKANSCNEYSIRTPPNRNCIEASC